MPVRRHGNGLATLVEHFIAVFLIGGHLLFAVSSFIAISTGFHLRQS